MNPFFVLKTKMDSKNNIVTDIIIILDKSASMSIMGKEPIQSVNVFIENLNIQSDEKGILTFVVFNNDIDVVIDKVPLISVTKIDESKYVPCGGTALNDCICTTINDTLTSDKPNGKVVVIITDGYENSSIKYSTNDTRILIKNCQDNHDWKFIFLGANIDAFSEGESINIGAKQCGQFFQECPGNLVNLCRETSNNILTFCRSRSEGSVYVPDLVVGENTIL